MATMATCSCLNDWGSVDGKQWNKIIKDQVIQGNYLKAILLYRKMLERGYHGDNYTFPILVKAASNLSCVHTGAVLHGQTIKTGFWKHGFVQTALINFYSAVVHVDDACKVFNEMTAKDLIAWNSMLNAYASAGQMDNAGNVFHAMPVKDQVSFNTIISGYANAGNVEAARHMFDTMGEEERDVVSWNSMILAFVNIGDMGMARQLFHRMPVKNLVSWNTMLCGYLQIELYEDVLHLFNELMSTAQLEPTHITLTTVSSACAHIGALDIGTRIHIYAINTGLTMNPHVVSSLVDMYAKCGCIERALHLFYKYQYKDIYCWNVIISGLALHGNAPAALRLFQDMKTKGVTPDHVTFIGVLSACSHAGMLDEGRHLFETMKEFGVSPKSEHYGCMVDLLARAGFLNSAIKLIETMPFEPGQNLLGALLSGCIIHQDTDIGNIVAKRITTARADCLSDGEYVMLSTLHALCGRWDKANRWRRKMGELGINKTAGCSSVMVKGRIYTFLAGEIK